MAYEEKCLHGKGQSLEAQGKAQVTILGVFKEVLGTWFSGELGRAGLRVGDDLKGIFLYDSRIQCLYIKVQD